jgi:NAD(P)H dehydrogenase (quinone)
LSGWKRIVEDGILRVPYSIHSKFSFIDLEDLAEAAKVVLTELNHQNATYELAGTFPMSHVEVAKACRRVLNCDVRVETEEIRDWRLRVEQSGMSEYAIENLIKMFEYYDQWGLVGNPRMLGWILMRAPTSIESFIERMRYHSGIGDVIV